MTDAPQPTSGSLEARIIRACTKHNNKCGLECPRRKVEDLGTIASFDFPEIERKHSFIDRLKEVYRGIACS